MEIDDLQQLSVGLARLAAARMATHLILSLVADNYKERTVLVLHTILHKRMNTRINDFFHHDSKSAISLEEEKKKKTKYSL